MLLDEPLLLDAYRRKCKFGCWVCRVCSSILFITHDVEEALSFVTGYICSQVPMSSFGGERKQLVIEGRSSDSDLAIVNCIMK